MVQISTLTEAVMVLSQEHRALTEAHKKIEADEKAYQDAYLTGIESISKVVDKCFTKVEEFSTESTALSAQNILTIEENVDALQKLVQVSLFCVFTSCIPHLTVNTAVAELAREIRRGVVCSQSHAYVHGSQRPCSSSRFASA
jgi:hypothetical protein